MRRRILLSIGILLANIAAYSQTVGCNFTASALAGCPPLVVNFQDVSGGNPTSQFWDFDNGNTSTNSAVTATFANPGIYNVKHVVSNGSSTDSCFRQIRVFQPATVNFTSANNRGCIFPCHTVNLVNQTIPGESPVVQYVWDFGDGSLPSQTFNAQRCYNQTGTYNVTLVALDSNGCQTSLIRNNYVIIGNKPDATITASPTQACTSPTVVNFTANATSSNGAVTYNWQFGNGSSSTQQNPTQVYFNGIFNPFVVVQDTLGCQDTARTTVRITQLNAGFTVQNVNACSGVPIQFTDTSNFANSWSWNFGDGGTSTVQNPTHTYANNGTYDVTLNIGFNGCTDSETQTAYINVTSPASVTFTASTPTTSCTAPFTVNFTSTTSGATSFLWNFGDGTTSNLPNPSHTYTSTGAFTVTLSVTNAAGCVNTFTRTNYIGIGQIFASFSVDSVAGCSPLNVQFTSTSTSNSPITSYQWDFGNGAGSVSQNPSYTYTSAGTYVPSLIIQNADGCRDTVQFAGVINVGQTLNAQFVALPTVACVNQQVSYINQTLGIDSVNTQFLWEFGDGSTSTLQNPFYAYTDTGRYTVTLTVINQGCASTLVRNLYIRIVVPKADFNFEFDCSNPTTVAFRDTSVGADSWFWNFGDGATSTQQHPTHTFPGQGNYTVTLIVTNTITGCVDSMRKTLPIGNINADFAAINTTGCAPFQPQLRDSSVFASSWLWLFGDGTTSTVRNPNKTYNTPGVYTVTLIINPGQLCSDTITKTDYITVTGPRAGFIAAPSNGCAPYTLSFTDTSTTFLGTIVSWRYIFGSTGDTAFVQNPTYTFNNRGTYQVRLVVTDNNGCTATATRNVAVRRPSADFSSDTAVCPGEAVTFNNLSGNGANAYIWDFGDGTTSTLTNPTKVYANSGNYTITLIAIQNPQGCRDTLTRFNYLAVDTPVADFYVTTSFAPCPPFPVQFYNTTNRFDLNWLWYFGDGDTSTARDPLHVYFFPGDYDVTLIAWDSSGCVDTITYIDLIRVRGPIGNFIATPDSGCVPLTVSISGSTFSTVTAVADLGDGTSFSNTLNITHTYQNVGTYFPVFTLTDSLGCSVPYPVDTIVVGLIPYPDLPEDTTVCKGNYVQFNLPYGDRFLWTSFPSPTYLDCDTCQNPLSTAPDTITYFVTAITNIGCVARDTITVNVDALPIIFPGINFRICPNDTLELNAGPGVQSATWTPNMFINDTNVVNPLVWPPDSMVYRVTGTNSTGCSISRIVRVWTIDKVVADIVGGDRLVCEGVAVPLEVRVLEASANDTNYLWSPDFFMDNVNSPTPVVAPPPGTYAYSVLVSSKTCEPDTATVNITISPSPTLEAGDDQTVAVGTTVQLYAASPDNVTYSWVNPLDDLSCLDCRRPFITATQSQTVYVSAINEFGCKTLDSVVLRVVSCDPESVFIPNTFTPNGDGLNDVLYVRGIGLRKLDYFRVYDRWGRVVFETRNIGEGWDGTIGNRGADNATYVYMMKGECTSGSTVEKSGNVTIVR